MVIYSARFRKILTNLHYFLSNYLYRYRLFKETPARELYPNDGDLKTKSLWNNLKFNN